MTTQRLVECFEGKPVSQLDWCDLLRYNLALTRLNVASGAYRTGNTPGDQAAQHGITWKYEQQPTQQAETKPS